jgi:hypothetical protein
MVPEFTAGHGSSVNAARLPADQRPVMHVRAMTADRGDAPPLPDDIPNARGHTAWFMLRLLGAWVAMGVRNPPVLRSVKEAANG